MFDRTTWIALALSVAGLVGWQWYYNTHYAPILAAQHEAEKATPVQKTLEEAKPNALPVAVPPFSKTALPQLQARREPIDTPRAEYLFENNLAGIDSITLFLHLGEQSHSLQLNNLSPMPVGALLESPDKPLQGFSMESDKATGKVSFQRSTPNGLTITKNFTLPECVGSPEEYLVNLDITFTNSSKTPLELPAYYLSIGGATPVHTSDLPTYLRFDSFSGDKMTSIDVNWFSPRNLPIIGIPLRSARDFYEISTPDISWVAVTSQYFCTILTAQEKGETTAWANRFEISSPTSASKERTSQPIYGIQGGLRIEPLRLNPGTSAAHHFTLFAGPKDFAALEKLEGGQQHVMNFGIFHLVSEFLLWAMNSLKVLLGNYASAIIVLTLLIKSILWPLQNKATNSMRRMQLLSPRITELREKYKDNPTKMNEELMKLYKHYGVNPFGGCLPMLIQIPIFFGFYSMLGTAIELRNSHFLWITDLSQPDTITHIMGYPFNLLPIIMAGTMLWQMSLSPKGGDPAQQRVMFIMPVVFLAFCYNFASALALYWTTQNLFSIAQLYLTRNQSLPTLKTLGSAKKKFQIKRR